jgi:hypothetical protein
MMNYLKKSNGLSFFVKFFAWLLIFLLILEVFTRSFIVKSPNQHFVPGLGYVPVDNSAAVWGVEGYGVTHYLSNGEISTPYQSEISVVVLGDSFTEALQVSNNQKFVSVAETILHDRGVKMDLHNLGASGRSVADYVYMAPFIRTMYSPDFVVVQLSEADFTESLDLSRQNFFARNGTSIELVHNTDYYVFNLNLRNMVNSTGLGSLAIYKLTPVFKEQRLRLATALAQNQVEAKEKNQAVTEVDQNEAVVPEKIQSAEAVQSQVEEAVAAPSGLNSSEIGIQLNLLKAAYPDSQVAFLVIPNIPVIQGAEIMLNNEGDDLLVEAMSEFSDLPLIYPRDGFVELYTMHKKFPRGFSNTLPDYGHLNVDGNFVVGVALADYLEGIAR